ncbi:hypothetical protein OAC51_09280 [Flavobacteriaceae bacterium]|nr:hypothetical protein [Flavobacteriaceae bacterium]
MKELFNRAFTSLIRDFISLINRNNNRQVQITGQNPENIEMADRAHMDEMLIPIQKKRNEKLTELIHANEIEAEIKGKVITTISSDELGKVATQNNVFILVRQSNEYSVLKKEVMDPAKVYPKPVDVKEKTLSEIDLEINKRINPAHLGYVGCFDPYEEVIKEKEENKIQMEADLNFNPDIDKSDLFKLMKSIYPKEVFNFEITNIPDTIRSINDNRDGIYEHNKRADQYIAVLKRINSRKTEYDNRIEIENKTSETLKKDVFKNNYVRENNLLYKVMYNVDGFEHQKNPIVGDNDLWAVFCFPDNNIKNNQVVDSDIKEMFCLHRGIGAIMHGAQINWVPKEDLQRQISLDVIDKQKTEPVIIYVPGIKKPISMMLENWNKIYDQICKSPSEYFEKTKSLLERVSLTSSEENKQRFLTSISLVSASNAFKESASRRSSVK